MVRILPSLRVNLSPQTVPPQITKISPYIKALFASGYTMDIINRKELPDEGMDFILKPVSSKDL